MTFRDNKRKNKLEKITILSELVDCGTSFLYRAKYLKILKDKHGANLKKAAIF